jgi:hypothetical protein
MVVWYGMVQGMVGYGMVVPYHTTTIQPEYL